MTNWINIISLTYPQEAYMAKSILESEGIEVLLQDEFTVLVNGFYSNAIGGIKLLIPEDDKEKALEVLIHSKYINPPEEKTPRKEIFPLKNKEICPYCNSHEVTVSKQGGISFVVSYLLGFPLPFIKKAYYCFDCEKEWIVKNKN